MKYGDIFPQNSVQGLAKIKKRNNVTGKKNADKELKWKLSKKKKSNTSLY